MSQKVPRPNRGQPAGRSNQTQRTTKGSSLGAKSANEDHIAKLRTAMDAAAAVGDVAAYKKHHAEYAEALKARSAEQTHQLNERHLAAVERSVAMADYGLRQVPARWLKPRHNTRVALGPGESFSFNGLDEAEVLRSA